MYIISSRTSGNIQECDGSVKNKFTIRLSAPSPPPYTSFHNCEQLFPQTPCWVYLSPPTACGMLGQLSSSGVSRVQNPTREDSRKGKFYLRTFATSIIFTIISKTAAYILFANLSLYFLHSSLANCRN